jgi:branched-chain amino acid transport system ATP-binding protein
MLFNVANITSGYGRVRIVKDVSFSIAAREILAIIGRNGVGKTTLKKTMIGSIAPMSGRIDLAGQNITHLSSAGRARLGLGYVPQGRGIFARMSVADNLILGKTVGTHSGAPNFERVYRFFPILRERLQQLAGSMSGGQQQQLAIGRILVGNPRLILLDEPSEGIQPNIVQRIAQIIRRLRDEQGLAVIIVEQNLSLIQAVADRCVVMDKGVLVAEVTKEQLADPSLAKRYLAI